jgi:hypothetical protein
MGDNPHHKFKYSKNFKHFWNLLLNNDIKLLVLKYIGFDFNDQLTINADF